MQVSINHFRSCGLRKLANLWLRADFRRLRRVSATIAATAAAIVFTNANPAAAQIPCSYELAAIIQAPASGGLTSPIYPQAISPNGRYVVGFFNPGGIGFDRAFAYDTTTQQFIIIPLPPNNISSAARDVNDAGLVVGKYGGDGTGEKGFVWSIPQQTYLHVLASDVPGGNCEATGINSSNVVCGFRAITGAPNYLSTAFRWSAAEGFDDLGVMSGPNSVANAIAEDGTIVGYTGGNLISSSTRAFIWRNGAIELLPEVPGGTNSAASAVIDASHVAVRGRAVIDGIIVTKGFAYYNGELVHLGTLPGHVRTFPRGFDGHGQLVGACATVENQISGFLWRDGQLVALSEMTTPSKAGVLTEPYAAAASGSIVGQGINAQGQPVAVVLDAKYARAGDTNCDGVVNVSDLLKVIGSWGPCAGCSADVDGDLQVDVFDLFDVILNWG